MESGQVKEYLGFLLIILILSFVGWEACSRSPKEKKPEAPEKPVPTLSMEQKKQLDKLERQGYISFESGLNRVYVNPDLWAQTEYVGKEFLAAAAAIQCAINGNISTIYVEVFDKISGKKIAKYSELNGLTVY
jgi:hypothetical protein